MRREPGHRAPVAGVVAGSAVRQHLAHCVSNALYNAVAARYGFAIPDEYRRLESRGLFRLSGAAHASAFYRPGSYLWLHDMDWYSPQAILDFKFEPYHLPLSTQVVRATPECEGQAVLLLALAGRRYLPVCRVRVGGLVSYKAWCFDFAQELQRRTWLGTLHILRRPH